MGCPNRQTTNKASIGRKAALGLRHIGLFEAPSPSPLRSRRHVAIRPTSCVLQTLLPLPDGKNLMETTYDITLAGGKKVNVAMRDFTISTDQPLSDGGENSAPAPFELFLASLGTCAGYFVVSFCQARNIPAEGIKMTQTVIRNDANHMVEKIVIDISLPAGFPDKYKDAVIRAAESCTVRKHLATPPQIQVNAR